MANGRGAARQLRTELLSGTEGKAPSPKIVDFGITIAISAAAGLALPFVEQACAQNPAYGGLLKGGWLTVASLSLAAWWATRRTR